MQNRGELGFGLNPKCYNSPIMQVNDLGEFGVIDLLNGMVTGQRARPQDAAPPQFPLLVDTGDDTAAWRTIGVTELFTTDSELTDDDIILGYDGEKGVG